MRGSPLVRALVVFVAMLALAPALWRMTAEPAAMPAPQAPVVRQGPGEVRLELMFTAEAERVEVWHLGREAWSKDGPDADGEEVVLELPWPKEGGDLLFKVTWPESARRAAMRVRLTAPDGAEIERMLWGSGVTEKVLNFP